MKKNFISLILILIILITGCTKKENKLTVTLPSGTPLVAVGGLLDDIDYNKVNGPDLLVSALTSTSSDIVIAPLVNGTKLYINNATIYKLAAIITFGNNYIISKKEMNSLSDLQNQILLAYGKNSIPDIVLNRAIDLCKVNINIDYTNSVNDAVAPFINNKIDYILSAEPTLSNIEKKVGGVNIIDLQNIIKINSNLIMIPQAAIFINPKSKRPIEIDKFLSNVKNNINYLNENPISYIDLIIDKDPFFNQLGRDVLINSIPRSNINYLEAKNNIKLIEDFFYMINTYNEMILNNSLPNESFYY